MGKTSKRQAESNWARSRLISRTTMTTFSFGENWNNEAIDIKNL